MKTEIRFVLLFYIFFQFSGSLRAIEEQTLVLGASSGWNLVGQRRGVAEVSSVRPYPVLLLSSGQASDDPSLDMALSFDEGQPGVFRDKTGNYSLSVSPALSAAGQHLARFGTGAALFSGNRMDSSSAASGSEGPLVAVPRSPEALFSSGQSVKDFTIEFWLFPANAENGEQILSWSATRQSMQGQSTFQRIQCMISGNRLLWNFLDFFASPRDDHRLTLSVTSSSPLIPQVWSHHLIRFDSGTGMIEYLVNGSLEGIVYASSSGGEGGDIYAPIIGSGGSLVLGGRFSGLMDEFRMYSRFVETPVLTKYPPRGGRFRTEPINLGTTNSSIVRIDALCGRTSAIDGAVRNDYTGASGYVFPDNSELRFFLRAADSPYRWSGGDREDDSSWMPFIPGTELPDFVRGQWVQVEVELFPSGDGETTPYVDEIRVTYIADEAPTPPSMVRVIPRDGAVDLSWRASPAADIGGYLVYYGTSMGEYFGESAILGVSPINVGNRTSIHIDGLENGTLYYFSIAAYDRANPPHIGEFSREVTARPLRTVP
ncbi:LamG-like jellyroll fold domain-containing protein [Breznakiella homolactica]|uniref:Fibronectin type-III domain-containing protein n=1 Tax=Breznakiella homolactica TaxID=2798577 RepID=A0A7T8BAX2_9SPIR|nr:LamG-like jellyroll fold domain-containing protein [Breznakiella homolactica]QQO09455.1 hypothetical protein JFL75_00595 [Breznakiella homolactica]